MAGLKTGNNIQKRVFQKEHLSKATFGNQYFVVIQFATLPAKSVQKSLKKAGVELHGYLPGNAYLATINSDFDFAGSAAFKITSINDIPSFYKIDPALVNRIPATGKQNEKKIAVSFYPSIDRTIVIGELQKAGAIILTTKLDRDNMVFIQADQSAIAAIAAFAFC
jgi:hypothetical protein